MTHNSQIPQQLGQYLYQQINGDWSKAMLVLDCQHDEVITCQAFYEKEADETQHPIAVSDHIIDLFKTLFDSAIQNQPALLIKCSSLINSLNLLIFRQTKGVDLI